MKVVIDTNVVVSGFITSKGSIGKIRNAWKSRFFELLISKDILEEYIRVLGYPHLQKRHNLDLNKIQRLIKRISIFVTPKKKITIIEKDPDDNKFLECAVEGCADYIISGDVHLLELKKYQNIPIVTPAVFSSIVIKLIDD